jgi:transposase
LCRERYALAAAKALPEATQVADRWHLMENASRAFLDAVRKSMRQIRSAIGAATINPSLLTAAERIQYEGYLRREEENEAILGLAKNGVSTAQRHAMRAIELCRTAALGGHVERCDECGHQRVAYNSCRNKSCPKCQSLAR